MSNNWNREMPSAFSSGSRDPRKADAAAAAAASAYTKKLVIAKEAKRVAEAANFASEIAYPSLGAAKPVVAKSAMNFKQVVETPALPTAKAKEKEKTTTNTSTKAKPPITEMYEVDEMYEADEMYDEEELEEEEFNADLGSTRRRGDKGIW